METIAFKERNNQNKVVAIWLLIGVGMMVIQILLGGITRLSGSGLSITEWNVVTGALPPVNAAQWAIEFSKYQQTPQYRLLNSGFTISDFKSIFFWEWFHRLWARLIGIIFTIGFCYFFFSGKFKKTMVKPLLILFLLGALQGAVGWIMVMSGLDGDAVYVQPTKLALHFILALALLGYTFWFALQLLIPNAQIQQNRSLNKQAVFILGLLFFQLLYGALMAGHKAANVAPTWPDINGQLLPIGLYHPDEGGLNFINNKILIHFVHRGLAYTLSILVVVWSIQANKAKGTLLFRKTKWLPLTIILLQVLLGILSVCTSPQIVPNRWGIFEWMAQAHQFTAILLLLILIWMLFINRKIVLQNE